MNVLKQKIGSAALSFFLVVLYAPYTFGDDTEIFFNTSATSVKPNVLFVMDTSSSMRNNYDGETLNRIDRMKLALKEIIGKKMTNVNVGIMRFIRKGGAVVYPVKDIDSITSTSSIGGVTARIAASSDDAQEDTTSNVVTLDSEFVNMTTEISGLGAVDQRISQTSDDGEERANGTMYLNSSDLELMDDGGGLQKIGLRFPDVSIPTGATIISAQIEFAIDEIDNGAVSINIFGESVDTGTFSDANNVSGRTKTGASSLWALTGNSPAVGQTLTTPNFSAVVQEIVSDAAWNTTTKTITLLMERDSGTESRIVESFNGTSSLAPRLLITYSAVGGGTTTNLIGLRFQDLEIPQGVTILSATLDFTAAVSTSGNANYTIKGHDIGDSDTFTNTNLDISARPQTTAVENWNPSDWAAVGDVNTTPDLTNIVQEITDRADWCGGNSLSFIIHENGTLSTRIAKSFDDSAADSPTLRITYDSVTIPASANRCITKEYVLGINSSANDAEQQTGNKVPILVSTELQMINNGGTDQLVGLRFQDIHIPNGSVIKDAYLEFIADTSTSGATSLNINGQASDSADIFTTDRGDVSSRALSASTVGWPNVPSWTDGETYTTPDISTIVKEIVDRAGWVAGNDMAFIISGSGVRQAAAWDNNGALAAKLFIVAESVGEPVATTETVRDELLDIVDDMYSSAGTPIVDAYYEAALYYRGENVDKGKTRGTNSSSVRIYDRASHIDSYTGGTHVYGTGCTVENLNSTDCLDEEITGTPVYDSPIDHECQTNNIILLSDGEASQNESASKVKTLIGGGVSCADTGDEECGPELASFLYGTDQSPVDFPAAAQTVKTYTIGFATSDASNSYLKKISDAGTDASESGTAHFTSTSTDQLIANFEDILREASDVNATFVSPGVTVNSFNRLNHRDELYFSLFNPTTKPVWEGNLKRYRLDVSGDIYDDTKVPIDGIVATDPNTGFFVDVSRSWWLDASDADDGNEVALGGAAGQLPAPNARNIYTHIAGGSDSLTDSGNAFNDTNITKALLGITGESDTHHENLISWARGFGAFDTQGVRDYAVARNELAAPLHSIPHLVTYGGTSAAPDITIYYGDNQGFIHAIDGSTGIEQFAFIPETLLPNLNTFFENLESTDRPYGMDGGMTTWVNDANGDGEIVAANGDHVYLYAGMRRGGNKYYALDVTNRAAPEMLWSIPNASGDFSELGQSWSKPIKTKVEVGNTTREVLIFTGGYDTDQDDYTVRTVDSVGRAIFMVDALTGDFLWSGGPPNATATFTEDFTDMLYSIPSDIKVIDINGDGLADQMYVGDMGGQIWRFDINNGGNVGALVTGAVIADFGGATAADNRRFYHAPDVSVLSEGSSKDLMILVGSGYQAHPLDLGVNDRFYAIKDPDVFEKPLTYTKLSESDFYDATDNHLGDVVSGVNSQAARDAADIAFNATTNHGWYIRLTGTGEKVLAASTTVAGDVYFTTYEATSNTVGCTAAPGTAWLYAINVAKATPINNYDGIGTDTELTGDDRKVQLLTAAIAPTPQRLRVDGQDIICVGTECETITSAETLIKTYWLEED